jgi:hypothetical protein
MQPNFVKISQLPENVILIVFNFRPSGRRRIRRPVKRILDEAETGLLRPNLWRFVIITMMHLIIFLFAF